MTRYHNGRKGREFAMLQKKYVNNNYLKYWKLVKIDICHHYDVRLRDLEAMLFMYDYEFFTLRHICGAMDMESHSFRTKTLYPMQNNGYVEKVYELGNPVKSKSEPVYFKRSRTDRRARYSLTQKGRLLVQRVYKKLEGRESIKMPNKR